MLKQAWMENRQRNFLSPSPPPQICQLRSKTGNDIRAKRKIKRVVFRFRVKRRWIIAKADAAATPRGGWMNARDAYRTCAFRIARHALLAYFTRGRDIYMHVYTACSMKSVLATFSILYRWGKLFESEVSVR